jgi:Domain of unknown function (DUF6456)
VIILLLHFHNRYGFFYFHILARVAREKCNRNIRRHYMKPAYIERTINALNSEVHALDDRPATRSRTVRVNLAESPLSWLHARGKISDRQFAAGELLRRDYEQAGLGPRVTMAWSVAPAHRRRKAAPAGFVGNEFSMAARQRFEAAIAQAGAGLSDILWRVVCAGEAVPGAERALGWPVRSGRLVLTLALDRVAAFYQIR